ncbi:MAG: hypothetical protein H6Q69_3777 [Firmicutes bacterium]|nr:hypothetical protein [Bacillota bacterium]
MYLPPPLHALFIIREIPDHIMKGRDTMNIFEHKSCFLGKQEAEYSGDSLLSLLRLAKQIRQRLGTQGYLLDCYLSLFFEGVSTILTYEAANDGFIGCGEFQSLCLHVQDSTEPDNPHPLYLRIIETYEAQRKKLSFQDNNTQLYMLLVFLEDELQAYATECFVKEQVKIIDDVIDFFRLKEFYNQISQIVGEPFMEELNLRLKKRFLLAPIATVFAQGFTDELIDRLRCRDPETSRQIFQLMMDVL